ncbi:hypothetical protein ACFYP6_31200 [Streptomyces goshikiensis]|uniref:hypothetical protein n=1 Tax=Streptomyces goshikiensis TaxID=1942 RepID=UPI0036C83DBF
MDEAPDWLDNLLDGVSEPRLRLVGTDEARAMTVLRGLIDDAEQLEDVRRASGEMRFRLGSRLL